MGKVEKTYKIITDRTEGNEEKVIIEIRSKISWFSTISYVLFILLVYYFAFPLFIDVSFSILDIIFFILLLSMTCFYCFGIIWMFLGKEKIVLWKDSIYYSRILFPIIFDNKKFVFSETKNWNVNPTYPLDFYGTKRFSYRIAFNLAGGKIIFKHLHKVYRFADNVTELEANIIMVKILKYFVRFSPD